MKRHDFLPVRTYATYDAAEEDSPITPIAERSSGEHLYIKKITFSIYSPSSGGNGRILIRAATAETSTVSSSQTDLWQLSCAETKDVALDFGEQGIYAGEQRSIQIIPMEHTYNPPAFSIFIEGYISFRRLADV
jgi:hypothetical protein